MAYDWRNSLIASVKIAQKDLGLDDDTYRAMLHNVTGKTSCTACTLHQLQAVLAHLRSKGWEPAPRKANSKAKNDPLAKLKSKIAAQVLALGKGMEYAEGVLRRMYGESSTLGTATRAQLTACISALTRQQARM